MISVESQAATSSLRHLETDFMDGLLEVERVTLAETEKHAKSTTLWNDRTGETRRRITSGASSPTSGWIGSFGFASRFLENGTPPHDIVAHGRALRFVVNGTVFFRKTVHYPGTAERPFMQQARDFGQQVADHAGEFFAERAIRAHP